MLIQQRLKHGFDFFTKKKKEKKIDILELDLLFERKKNVTSHLLGGKKEIYFQGNRGGNVV